MAFGRRVHLTKGLLTADGKWPKAFDLDSGGQLERNDVRRKRLSLFCRDLFQLAENDVCKQRCTFGPHRSVGLTMDRKFGVQQLWPTYWDAERKMQKRETARNSRKIRKRKDRKSREVRKMQQSGKKAKGDQKSNKNSLCWQTRATRYKIIGSGGLRYIFCNVILQNFPSSLSQPGSAVTQGHRKWHRSIDCVSYVP